jgi:hypothetical protein
VDDQPQRARQLAAAWSEAASSQVQQAVASSQHVIQLDEELESVTAQAQRERDRLALLTVAPARIQDWQAQLSALPGDTFSPVDLRWQMAGLALSLTDGSTAWSTLLAGQPQAQTTAAQAAAWLQGVASQAALDAALLPTQIVALEQQQEQLRSAYAQAQSDSAGLSPNIAIERIGPPSVDTLRPTSTLALVGALIGLLAGLAAALSRVMKAAQ